MLFTKDLEQIVFNRHESYDSDELVVLSGYLGPRPVSRLETLPVNSKIIYGMYGSEGIKPTLHKSLISIQENTPSSLNIFYSKIPVHSKCYLWRKDGMIVYALVGSANFSINGLTTPLREILMEAPIDTYDLLNSYVEFIASNSISCLNGKTSGTTIEILPTDKCLLSLLMRNGEIHNAHGLNWGQHSGSNHTNVNDACIPINIKHIRAFPQMFPPKQLIPRIENIEGRAHRHNEQIEIIWDDGVVMQGLLEGDNWVDGVLYPKQISSFPSKNEMGLYFRKRLGVSAGAFVTKEDLEKYGRFDVEVKLLEDGIYSFDFSVRESFSKVEKLVSPYAEEMVMIPWVGSVPCGKPVEHMDDIIEMIPVEKSKIKPGANYFILQAIGDSMDKAGINDGDLVLCRDNVKPETGDKVVALLNNGDVTIKFYDKKDGRRILLPKSTNPTHKPIIPEEGDEVQGIVQEVIQSEE